MIVGDRGMNELASNGGKDAVATSEDGWSEC